MSKTIIRIATPNQYCYVEKEVDVQGLNPKDCAEVVKQEYDELYGLMNGGQKVSETAFNDYLIELMNSDLTKPLNAQFYEDLTDKQREVVQAVKRFKKRLPSDQEITIK